MERFYIMEHFLKGFLYLVGVLSAIGGAAGIWKIATAAANFKNEFETYKKDSQEQREKTNEKVETVFKIVSTELRHNGGTSLKDYISKLDLQMRSIAVKMNAYIEFDKRGIFICDYGGKNRTVNETYANIIGCTKEELLDKNWENFIVDVEAYRTKYAEAFLQRRRFQTDLLFKKKSGEIIKGQLTAISYPELEGYVGYIIWDKVFDYAS